MHTTSNNLLCFIDTSAITFEITVVLADPITCTLTIYTYVITSIIYVYLHKMHTCTCTCTYSYMCYQEVSGDVKAHEAVLRSLDRTVDELLPLLDEADKSSLSSDHGVVTIHYHHLVFDCSCYLVQCWLEDRRLQLCKMAPTGVLVSSLQDQIEETREFRLTVDGYKPRIDQLSSLTGSCRESTATDVTVSDLVSSVENAISVNVVEVTDCCDKLKTVSSVRLDMLSGHMPTLQRYASSERAWCTLLTGWEERVASLPLPGVTPTSVQQQIDDLVVRKLFLVQCTNLLS